MKVLVTARNAGKTTAAIREFHRLKTEGKDALIVTFDNEDAERLRRDWGLTKKDVVGIGYVERAIQGRRLIVIVEDLDLILPRLFPGAQIGLVTMTAEVEPAADAAAVVETPETIEKFVQTPLMQKMKQERPEKFAEFALKQMGRIQE